MKNIFKLKAIRRIAGIIALVAVIGFSMAACEEEDVNGDAFLTIVNQFNRPVTKVVVSVTGTTTVQTFDNLNITKGNSQTFTITEFGTSNTVQVTCSEDTSSDTLYRLRYVGFKSGKTVTITVNASGDLEE